MAVKITPEEILVFNPDIPMDRVELLLRDGLALAANAAPCILDDDFAFGDAAAAIIRGAILRWADSGSGALSSSQSSAGPFSQTQSYDTRQARRSLFFPSEITELQKLCKQNSGAFAVDTLPPVNAQNHAPECSFNFDQLHRTCTCGAWLNAGKGPLW